MERVKPAAKAWVAAVVAGVSAAIPTAVPLIDDGLTTGDVLVILGAFLVGSGIAGPAVYTTPNRPAE